jgi:hypothetical protein
MSFGAQGGRGLLATMWRLAVARQLLLLVILAMVLLDASAVAAVVSVLDGTGTFASFADGLFHESRSVADGLDLASGGDAPSAVALAAYVLVRPWPMAWLRASYIRALATTGGLPRPAWRTVVSLVLLDMLVATPLAIVLGLLEKSDLPALGTPLLLLVFVLTLYADFAIVIDGTGLIGSFRASLHVLLARPGPSFGATAAWLTFAFILSASLAPSFESGATPLTLTALLLFTGLLWFALDCCLITLYRATPPAEPADRL